MKEYDKEYYRRYYLEHRQEILDRNKKWRQNNKKRFYELIYKSRKKRAEVLKEKGEEFVWLSDKKRKEKYERINKSIKDEKI